MNRTEKENSTQCFVDSFTNPEDQLLPKVDLHVLYQAKWCYGKTSQDQKDILAL